MSISVGVPLVHVHPQGLDHLLHDGAGVMTVNEAQSASCPQGADICLENEGQRATRMSSISSRCVLLMLTSSKNRTQLKNNHGSL